MSAATATMPSETAYDAPHPLPYVLTLTSGTHSVASTDRAKFRPLGKVIGHDLVCRILDAVDARQFGIAGDLAYQAGVSVAYADPASRKDVYIVPVDPASLTDCDSCQ